MDLPETLIEHEVEHRVNSATERADRMGVTLEQALEAEGIDEVAFRSDAREHAVRGIKADLILESVSRQEDLEVTPEDLGREVAAIAQLTGSDPKKLLKQMNSGGQITSLAGDIIRSKALDVLVSHATVNGQPYVPASDEDPDESATDPTDDESEQG